MSLVNLIYLLDKIRDDYEFNPPFYPDLFRKAITVIQRQDGIPRMVLEELDKARIRVVDTDQPGEITQVLFSACQRYLGMKPNRQQVKMIQATPADYERQINEILHQVKAIEFSPQAQGQQKMTDGMPNKKTGYWKAKREKQKQQQQQTQGQAQVQQGQGQNKQGQNKQGQKTSKGPYKSGFVNPWPENCKYLAGNGNTLKPEFEAHFNGYCHKCGHSSHKAEKCKTYPGNTVILTLCKRCRQGLHDVCRSKRPGLPTQIVPPSQQPAPAQVKAITQVQKPSTAVTTYQGPPQYIWNLPAPTQPLSYVTSITQESDSDSD